MAHETDTKAGRVNREKVIQTTEAEIDEHAVQDEEAAWFDPNSAPDRVSRPYAAKPSPGK